TLVPVEDPAVHDQILYTIMTANLADTANSWEQQADGSTIPLRLKSKHIFDAHRYLSATAQPKILALAYQRFCQAQQATS
ncbi:MAG: hypothetical protein AAF352_08110, partial [Pseudomonadota bacterium]